MTTIGTMSSPRWRTVGVSIIVIRDEMGFPGNPGAKDIIPDKYKKVVSDVRAKTKLRMMGGGYVQFKRYNRVKV